MVAISNDTVEDSKALVDKLSLGFPILSDPKLESIKAFDIEHVGKGIAKPAVYVIGRDGKILYAFVGTVTNRPPVADVLAAIP